MRNRTRQHIFATVFGLLATAALPMSAAITVTGNYTGGGTPYAGQDPWNTSNLVIGNSAPGSMAINGGSVVNDSGGGTIGVGGAGSVIVDGAGSQWNNNGFGSPLYIGSGDTASLNVTNGGTVMTAAGAYLGGSGDTFDDVVNIGGGAGTSTWNAGSFLYVAEGAPGTVNIKSGGVLNVDYINIGYETGIGGIVSVGDGLGAASLSCTYLAVGNGGPGTLNINTGGIVTATQLFGGDTINFNGGTLRVTGDSSVTMNVFLLAPGGTIDVPTAGTTLTMNFFSGVGGLTKTGAGTLELVENDYQGGTTISGGTLRLSNSSGSATGTGALIVNSGGTLAGIGSASGAVTVNAGGTVAPGNSIGKLSIGSLTLASSSAVLKIELNASTTPAADLLNVTGTVSLGGGTLNLSFLNGPTSFAVPKTFLILSNDASDLVTGAFGSITGVPTGYVATVNYAYSGTDALGRIGTGNDVAVTIFSAVPEASAFTMGALAAAVAVGMAAWRKARAVPPARATLS